MKREIELILGLLMIMAVGLISGNMTEILQKQPLNQPVQGQVETSTQERTDEKYIVALDAGHGGADSGKVGINGTLEKDINLSIVYYIKEFLEENGVEVVLTRTDGNGLYSEGASNKKREDMNRRCQIIRESGADLVVSIHQNSYQSEGVTGAQVFYYEHSAIGKSLAEKIQKRFDYILGEKNTRSVKSNTNYYLLLHVEQPIVIVECGFLSNWGEAEALSDALYQERIAWTVCMGILQQLHEMS